MAAENRDGRWIIEGVRSDGHRIRPSEWIDRVSATLASFGDGPRLRHDHDVHPCIIQGEKYLVVGKGLSTRNPQLLADILKFAEANKLPIKEERRSLDLPCSIERRAAR